MWQQEKAHLEFFDNLVRERRVRPTILLPFWDIAGFMLGMYLGICICSYIMGCIVDSDVINVYLHPSSMQEQALPC